MGFAASQGRAVLTFNFRDCDLLHEAWLTAGRQHADIIARPSGAGSIRREAPAV
jgi:hypothetical protein